ncbi:MAG: transcription-repair coupling factor, partial [Proteobacteria bacterium]|nr:transcription-repair coupling factor [Pseudomonadota bacterium]
MPSLSTQRVPPTQTFSKQWPRRAGAALAFSIANLRIENHPTVVVARTPREHQLLLDEVAFFLEGSQPKPLFFSGWECLPYDRFSPHPEIVSQRIATLIDLKTEAQIVIIAADQLLARLAPPEFLLSNSFKLRKGSAIDPQVFRSRLSDSGYLSVSRVISPGEFAVRGGIIDVYPSGSEKPFRIDLFGNEIENIRFFDPESQKSIGETNSLSILPAREFPTDQNAIDRFRANYRRTFSGDPQNSIIYRDVSQGKFPSGIEFYLPLFFSHSATIFDYLPEHATWVVPYDLEDLLKSEWATLNDRYSQFSYDQERPPMPPGEISMAPQEVVEKIEFQSVIKTNSNVSTRSAIKAVSEVPVYPVDHQASEPFLALINRVAQSKEFPILVSAESAGRAETFLDLFRSYNLRVQEYSSWREFVSDPDAQVGICVSPIDRGLCIPDEAPEVVVESQLYGSKKRQNKRRGRSNDPEAIIRSIAELKPEDPIVHIDHGVGRYEGLKSLAIDGKSDEFIVVTYKGGGKLYIPVFNIGVLSRYIGGDSDTAPLHTLGGEQWEKARLRARKRAYDVGAELLKTQALRTLRVGKSLAVAEQQ